MTERVLPITDCVVCVVFVERSRHHLPSLYFPLDRLRLYSTQHDLQATPSLSLVHIYAPVERPPPKWVRIPKTTHCSLLALYMAANFSWSSSLETFARVGWITSKTICLRWSKRLVMNLRVRNVTGDVASILCRIVDEDKKDEKGWLNEWVSFSLNQSIVLKRAGWTARGLNNSYALPACARAYSIAFTCTGQSGQHTAAQFLELISCRLYACGCFGRRVQ